jgi:hypothetical protein
MIVCSAILAENGDIISGRRHIDCIKIMVKSGKYELPVSKNVVQGFLDDNGNFLNRIEARKHFIEYGQIPASGPNTIHETLLFSEDLY